VLERTGLTRGFAVHASRAVALGLRS
jgi:hypothetical protein